MAACSFRACCTIFQPTHIHGLQDVCKTRRAHNTRFQPTHIHGLQAAPSWRYYFDWLISTHSYTRIARGGETLVPILFRSLVFANLIEECYQSGVPWQASHKLGELLDLFFARLLPSGTGDFGIGPSQLREKQTNPIMVCTLSFDGAFFYFNSLTVSCWTYFLPGFYRAVPVISTPVLLSLGRSKRTRLCYYPIL